MAARTDSPRRGFVLPTTILVMTLLTVMLAAAFAMISAEFRTTDSSFAMRRAYALAQAGLQQYLGTATTLATYAAQNYDSLRVAFPDGYADVVARRLVDSSASTRALWVIRSQGVVTTASLVAGRTANRTVAILARRTSQLLPISYAFVAANPVILLGNGGNPLRGTDGCNVVDRPALLIAMNDYKNGTGSTPSSGVDSLATRSGVLDSTHIDWSGLVNGNFSPDYVYPSWPVWTGYPVGYAPGDVTIGSSGRGLLVVKGNLSITGGQWSGIILVGGYVRNRSGAQVNGMVVSGLNNQLSPNSVSADTLDRGSPVFQWNSCNVASSMTSVAAFDPVRQLWIDTWSTY